MEIDPIEIARQMLSLGHTKEKVEANDFENWTNDFMDVLEIYYGLERAVRIAITHEK